MWRDTYILESKITADNETEAKEMARLELNELLLDESYTRKRKIDRDTEFIEVVQLNQEDV